MRYEGNVIRPPSEADSIILQVTVGCSHNRCTFCGAYREVSFRIKSEEEIRADLAFAARHCRRQKRVFLADGDVLSLSERRLSSLFGLVREELPWIRRISLYGNAKNIRHKSDSTLKALKELGLDRIYMGLESGSDQLLQRIRKGVGSREMIEAALKIKRAGIFLSVSVLLGLGGQQFSRQHAIASGEVLSRMSPDQIAVLTLMLLPNTPLWAEQQKGTFVLPSPSELLMEFRLLLDHIHVDRGQLHANHASNYLPIVARLPRDKVRLLQVIDDAVTGKIRLKAENLRAL